MARVAPTGLERRRGVVPRRADDGCHAAANEGEGASYGNESGDDAA